LFDPLQYFALVDRTIGNCSEWAETSGPFLTITFNSFKYWEEILWRFEVKFPCGHRFNAFESHCWSERGEHLRKMVYRLMKENGELVFQVDPHREPIPYHRSPHLHLGPSQDDRIEDGDTRLGTNSLSEFDFIKMWEWVLAYIADGTVPCQR
jgi:hypothetical protein